MISQKLRNARRFWISLAATCILAACGTTAPADGEPMRHIIATQFEGQDGEVTVHLPGSYAASADKSYPVLYIPAGRRLNSKVIRRTLEGMVEGGEAPEVIIVTSNAYYRALPPSEHARGNGKGGEYLAHIRDELIPFIDAEYRTSSDRWLAGFSATGIFLVYTMVEAPDLFTGYILQSPAFDDDWLFAVTKLVEQRFALVAAPSIAVYMGIGDLDTRDERIEGFNSIAAMFEEHAPQNIRYRSETFPGERHDEIPELIRAGILHISAPR